MPTWYDAFGAEYNARNWSDTDQSRNSHGIAADRHFEPVDRHDNHGSAASHHADGRLAGFFGNHAADHDETRHHHHHHHHPAAAVGEHAGPVDVLDSHGSAGAGADGHHLPGVPGFGVEVVNFNITTQVQADPTIIVGDNVGPVDVSNSQSSATFQQADAGFGDYHLPGIPAFGAEVVNFNITTQIQADPTIVVGDNIGPVDVSNSQGNVADVFVPTDHHLIA